MLAVQYQFAHFVAAGGVGLLALYQDMSGRQFLRILLVAQALVLLDNVFSLKATFCLIRPADAWLRGHRTPDTAIDAWRALAGLPLDFLKALRFVWIGVSIVPITVYMYFELGSPGLATFLILTAGTAVVLMYGVFLRFFMSELILHPLVADIADELPDGAELGKRTVPLKWRLLAALPAINIITGVAVAGLAGHHGSLEDLGANVLVAIIVAFTISLELTVLLANSILQPLRQLRRGTDAVAAGDLTVRVPVIGSDEGGRLAASFNSMVAGLQERERLREAFGAYVDPQLAERVLAEGTQLAGEEVEVTVLFVDIRNFTAFAERATATEVVGQLNAFYELVVPVLARHGGHANKFVGDGLLAVFGAPDHLPDHADRAVAAASEIVRQVTARFGGQVRIGIGVNSGPVVAGTIGGGGRVEFTVIGDVVNTASRVESVTRETGDDILITEGTRRLLTRDLGAFVERPTVELKGKTRAVRIFAPADGVPVTGPAVGGSVRVGS
jgi:class 3 adenylate cyclase